MGRLAQWQSVCSTRRRSEVQILQRPPRKQGRIAQGLEHPSYKRKVGGSIPPAPTEKILKMKIEEIYEDKDLLVVSKPAGISVFPEGEEKGKTLIDFLLTEKTFLKKVGASPRYGIVHRLDKNTSGVLLIAKNNESLNFFQNHFKEGSVRKEYVALCDGKFSEEKGIIETQIARAPSDRRKQKAYPLYDTTIKGSARKAVTEYRVLKKNENCTLIKAVPLMGRKHQIRCHMAYIGNPIVGDTLYGFKNSFCDTDLNRHFLHAERVLIETPSHEKKEFISPLPKELREALEKIKI